MDKKEYTEAFEDFDNDLKNFVKKWVADKGFEVSLICSLAVHESIPFSAEKYGLKEDTNATMLHRQQVEIEFGEEETFASHARALRADLEKRYGDE